MTSQQDLFAAIETTQTHAPTMSTEDYLQTVLGLEMDVSLADGAARFQGVDPQHSYIVQAPAGSGKTSLLAQRFLALLSQVKSPEQIVAMTFTKKAAAEMRERILHALQSGLKPLPEDAKLVEQNTWKLAQKALENDREQGWNLLQNPNRLRIKTIDGLNGYLVSQMPYLSKVGGQPRLLDNPLESYQLAVRKVLKTPELEEAVGRLLRLVNGRFQRAENLLINMLGKRDQWMRTLIQFKGDAAKQRLQSAIKEIVSQSLKQNADALFYLGDRFVQACELASYAAEHNQPQLNSIRSAWPFSDESIQVEQWRILADWLLTKQDEIRKPKGVTKSIGFPAGKGEAKERKEEFIEVLEALQNAAFNDSNVLPAIVALKSLPDPFYSDEQWQDLQWLIDLLTLSVAHLKLVFQQQGQADYIEIAQAASIALGSELEPTDLAQQLDYQIQHLLVDEFQDTSSEQYRLLMQLVAGWQANDGRTLFLVGDPMQSIYRFREAEVGNFLKAWQGKLAEVDLQQLNLSVNFRSSAGVVNWVNEAFSKILPVENDIEKGAVCYTPSLASSSDDNRAVNGHWDLNRSALKEAQQVVDLVKQRLEELKSDNTNGVTKKIAILGRTRSSLITIAQLLKEEQIGFRAVELESLAERQEIEDVLALFRAFMHLTDREAWIALLRSPLVGLNLADLTHLIADLPYQSVWASIEQNRDSQQGWNFANNTLFSEEAVQRLNFAIPVLDQALQNLGAIPFVKLIKQVWLQLDGPQTVENQTSLENVEVLFQTLAESEELVFNQQQLQQAVERLYARPDSAQASQQVELMTMHKSKGLEFDTVILPGLGRKPRGDESELVSWFQFMDKGGNEQLVLAPIDQAGTQSSLLREMLKGFEKQKQRFESGRLLYVAATRAKKQLHLFASAPFKPTDKQIETGDLVLKPTTDSLLETMWPFVKPGFMDLIDGFEPLEEEPEAIPMNPLISRLPIKRQGFKGLQFKVLFEVSLTPESSATAELPVIEGSGTSDSQPDQLVFNQQNALLNTLVGNLVHAVFEQMAEQGIEGWGSERIEQRLPLYQRWLHQQGLPNEQMKEALDRVKQSLANAIGHQQFIWAVGQQHTSSASEYALTSKDEQSIANHIVDRTLVDQEGVRWIIDYKTSVYEGDKANAFIEKQVEKYRPQLERYGKLFEKMEQRPQKWVLYFSYLNRWVELEGA